MVVAVSKCWSPAVTGMGGPKIDFSNASYHTVKPHPILISPQIMTLERLLRCPSHGRHGYFKILWQCTYPFRRCFCSWIKLGDDLETITGLTLTMWDDDIRGNIRINSQWKIEIPSSDGDDLCAFLFVVIIAMFSFECSVKGYLQHNFDPAGELGPEVPYFAKRRDIWEI
jgi:hypothetical protein